MSESTYHQRENIDDVLSGGSGAEGPGVLTTNVDRGPPGGARARDLGAQRLRSPPLGQGSKWLQKPMNKCSKSS
jgi:hypothetical protein